VAPLAEVNDTCERILAEVERAIVGKRDVLERVLLGLLADGHVLLEDVPGPDEINRAPPKTQAALLEAMQEGQVTTEGETRPLEPPFVVLATQNPIEYEGTYPLPEAQLDRFLLRTAIGYPSRDEWQVLSRRASSSCSARWSRCTCPSPSGCTWSTSSRRRGPRRASRSGRARAGRSRC
jgi:MoxR-like ATPase